MLDQAAAEQQKRTLDLIFKDQLGPEIHFKVKPNTKFEKVRTLTYAVGVMFNCF